MAGGRASKPNVELIPSPDEKNPSLANPASSTLEPPGLLRPRRFRSLRLGISLRMSRDLTELCHPALLNLLRLGSCSEQLLHLILKLLGTLRLLLPPGLKLLLHGGKLSLSLIARLCGFAQSRTRCNDLG